MGLYDSMHGLVSCPYCGHETFISFQTKGLAVNLSSVSAGGRITGGPYLNGEYGRHRAKCEACEKEYLPVAVLKDQTIEGLKSYRIEDIPACSHLPEDVRAVALVDITPAKLGELIVLNIIALLIDERTVIERGEFDYQYITKHGYDPARDYLQSDWPGRQVARLFDYLHLLYSTPDFEKTMDDCLISLCEDHLPAHLGRLHKNFPILDDLTNEELLGVIANALPVGRQILQRFAEICKQKNSEASD